MKRKKLKTSPKILTRKVDNSHDFLIIKNFDKFESIHIGIDEAGRGPVLGYMNYSAFVTTDPKLLLKETVSDSKIMTSESRERFLNKIVNDDRFGIVLYCMHPHTISVNMNNKINLNQLAYFCIENILNVIKQKNIKVESATVDALGSCDKLKKFISNDLNITDVTVEMKADTKYRIVSAASVVAKVTRDTNLKKNYSIDSKKNFESQFSEKEINSLDEIYKLHYEKCNFEFNSLVNTDYGSGYTSDEITRSWLDLRYKTFKKFPSIVRKSWSTAKKYEDSGENKTIKKFLITKKKKT